MINRLDCAVKCPYYIRSAEYSITCEGLNDGQEIATRFSTRDGKEYYAKHHCELIGSKCPIRQMLNEKYEKKENER